MLYQKIPSPDSDHENNIGKTRVTDGETLKYKENRDIEQIKLNRYIEGKD